MEQLFNFIENTADVYDRAKVYIRIIGRFSMILPQDVFNTIVKDEFEFQERNSLKNGTK
jgi:hypothetical protein